MTMRKWGNIFVVIAVLGWLFTGTACGDDDDDAEPATYTVTYEPNGDDVSGTTLPIQGQRKGSTYMVVDASTIKYVRYLYRFDGWSESATGEVVYKAGDMIVITEDITLYAHWTPIIDLYTFHDTLTVLEAGTDGTAGTSATYAYFGDMPQTIKGDSVSVDIVVGEKSSVKRGADTFYRGDDGNYYVRVTEKAANGGYTYSDGTAVALEAEKTQQWFKVEPIKWRVLSDDYNGGYLLLAESILTGRVSYYPNTALRTIDGATVYPNNYAYSAIRAYLNGTPFFTGAGLEKDTAGNDIYAIDKNTTYEDKGFLQQAFTTAAQALIADTTWDGVTDKLFLPAHSEVTAAYGFGAVDAKGKGTLRLRIATDYAKAQGALQGRVEGTEENAWSHGGAWWLRSIVASSQTAVYYVDELGDATETKLISNSKNGDSIAVVPLLVVTKGTN